MKYVMTAVMTAHLVYYMNQKEVADGIPSLIVALVLAILLIISEF